MTCRVQLLARDVAERIAAGEVIERPASVVKELVENALDAGATRIQVELQAGGLEGIRVQDDGSGMSREELELAVQRFATSKIRAWEDLDRLQSYGFRGEALPSVGAISRLEVASRPRPAEWGWRLVMRGGTVERLEEAGCPPGTTVAVTHLFYNTPARRKFMKSPLSEAMRVQDLLAAMSLAAPRVHVTLRHQGKDVLDLPAVADLAPRLRRLWSLRPEQVLMPVHLEREDLGLEGWVSGPGILWPNRRRLFVFVNRRLVAAPALTHAVAEALGVARGRYPMGALLVDLPPDRVDVNVHPTKAEVRFRDVDPVYRLVRDGVAVSLRRCPAPPLIPPQPAAADWRHLGGGAEREPFAGWPEPGTHGDVWQIDGLLAVLRAGNLWLIDPHVFVERRLRQELQDGADLEPVLFPLMVEFSAAEAPHVLSLLSHLARFGLDLEPFGPRSFRVRSAAIGFERLLDPQRLEKVIRAGLAGADIQQCLACHAAWPEREPLTALQASTLASEVGDADLDPAQGAHGRPAAVRLSPAGLRDLFRC